MHSISSLQRPTHTGNCVVSLASEQAGIQPRIIPINIIKEPLGSIKIECEMRPRSDHSKPQTTRS